MLHPPLPLSPVPADPPLRRSTCLRFPFSHTATLDSLLPNPWVAAAMSESITSSCSAAVPSGPVNDDGNVLAFLAEFMPYCDMHYLMPVDVIPSDFLSVPEVLAAAADGSLEPEMDADNDPLWSDVLASPEWEYWIASAQDEIHSLQDLKVFVLIPWLDVPASQRPLRGKLVCKHKRDDSGKVVRYKVHYVAKGFAQRFGIDYNKTMAPTSWLESLWAISHLTASLNWDLHQFDIKMAFLHGILPLDETMFMEQPPGFKVPGKQDWVWWLLNSIYGMKQASRIWNKTFNKAILGWNFIWLSCKWCVYICCSPTGTIIFSVHIDDIFSAASSAAENDRFAALLKSKWEISKLGPAKFTLGITFSCDRSARTITLSQTAFIDKVVNWFNLSDAHSCDTPMVAGLVLRRPDKAIPIPPEIVEWQAQTPYHMLVGALNYIAVGTQPDIAFTMGHLSSFMDCYTLDHWSTTIHVIRYLKGTRTFRLTLGGTNPLHLVGYSDSDYANCPDTSCSISGYCFNLGSGTISWMSKKQRIITDSSCYAEYIALHDSSHELAFLRELLTGLNFTPSAATPLLCDNDTVQRLAEDHVGHPNVKHIQVKFHHICELVEDSAISLTHVCSSDNTADILTKPLTQGDFLHLWDYLSI
jgi:hypothetical protein